MTITDPYCPERGDIIWIDFDPAAGREQTKRRPALVLSQRIYNQASQLCVVCPITSKAKGYPFEAALPTSLKIGKGQGGVVLVDQIRSMSWAARRAESITRCTISLMNDVRAKLQTLLL